MITLSTTRAHKLSNALVQVLLNYNRSSIDKCFNECVVLAKGIEESHTRNLITLRIENLKEAYETGANITYAQDFINTLLADIKKGTKEDVQTIPVPDAVQEEPEVDEYAETPVEVPFLEGADEVFAENLTYKDKLEGLETTKPYVTGKMPLIALSSAIITTDEYEKAGIQAKQVSLYCVLEKQYVIGVRTNSKGNGSFNHMKPHLLKELECLLNANRENMLEAKEAYIEMRSEYKETIKLLTIIDDKLAPLNEQFEEKATQLLKEKAIFTSSKGRDKDNSRKRLATLQKSIDKLEQQRGVILQERVDVQRELNDCESAYFEYYYPKEHYIAKREQLKEGIALVTDNKLNDFVRDVWRKLEKTFQYEGEDEEEVLAKALKALNKKTSDKYVIVSEHKVVFPGKPYKFYWAMTEKSFNYLCNCKSSKRAKEGFYVNFPEWGFAF